MTQINQERLVEHFCQLVRIDSESMNENKLQKRWLSNWAN